MRCVAARTRVMCWYVGAVKPAQRERGRLLTLLGEALVPFAAETASHHQSQTRRQKKRNETEKSPRKIPRGAFLRETQTAAETAAASQLRRREKIIFHKSIIHFDKAWSGGGLRLPLRNRRSHSALRDWTHQSCANSGSMVCSFTRQPSNLAASNKSSATWKAATNTS